jgi:hypothetical protein
MTLQSALHHVKQAALILETDHGITTQRSDDPKNSFSRILFSVNDDPKDTFVRWTHHEKAANPMDLTESGTSILMIPDRER